MIDWYRKRHFFKPLRVDRQVTDNNIPFTRNQRRNQFGKIINQDQFRYQSMRERKFLRDALLLGHGGSSSWQVGGDGIVARQQYAQLALTQNIDEISVKNLRFFECGIGSI